MRGMNDRTGKHNDGFEYLKQRIRDILSTPLGSRVMRRYYGSELFKRIDNPTNGKLIANIYSDCVTALYNFEPEFEIVSVTVVSIDRGRIIWIWKDNFSPTAKLSNWITLKSKESKE